MGKWLEAVRQKSEMGGGTAPTKPTKAPSVGSVGAPPPGNSAKQGEAASPSVGSVSSPSGPFGDNEPEARCPACGSGRWWQDHAGAWWCEQCTPFEPGQWMRLVELPGGERPAPLPVTDSEVEAAVAMAERHGWSREAFRQWCGGDWSALPEPRILAAMLEVVTPHPGLDAVDYNPK